MHSKGVSSFLPLFENADLPGKPVVSYDCINREFIDLYPSVRIEEHDAQAEFRKYLKRKESFSESIVVTKSIQNQHICKIKEYEIVQIDVLTEFIPWRLHLFEHKLSFEEVIFILFHASKGFRQLFHRAKFPFLISASMIGISEAGLVRVWWNENFSKNNQSFLHNNISVGDMVKSIFATIFSYGMIGDKKLLQFQDKLNKIESINFVNGEFMIKKEIELIHSSMQTLGKELVRRDPGFRKSIQISKEKQIKSQIQSQFTFQSQNSQINKYQIIDKGELEIKNQTNSLNQGGNKKSRKKIEMAKRPEQIIQKHGIKLEQSKTLFEVNRNQEKSSQKIKGHQSLKEAALIGTGPIGLSFRGSLKKVIRFKYLNANMSKQSIIMDDERSKSLEQIKSFNSIADHKRSVIEKDHIISTQKKIMIKSSSQPKMHAHSNFDKLDCIVCQNLLRLRKNQRSLNNIPNYSKTASPNSKCKVVQQNILKKSAPINFLECQFIDFPYKNKCKKNEQAFGQKSLESSFIQNGESMITLIKNNPQIAMKSQLQSRGSLRKQSLIDRLQRSPPQRRNQF